MRLIDADALMAKLTPEDWRTPDERWMPERQIGAIIQNAPTIDAVEVVRCKDCKWYKDDGCFFSTADVEPNDYCSYGKRSE